MHVYVQYNMLLFMGTDWVGAVYIILYYLFVLMHGLYISFSVTLISLSYY
jgi:hypothetical protein